MRVTSRDVGLEKFQRRNVTISIKQISKRELEAGRQEYPESYERPKTRGECSAVSRPCPFVACRYNLFLDVSSIGSIKFNHPELEPDEMAVSCALDVADQGGASLEAVGSIMSLTRERTRQIEDRALVRLRIFPIHEFEDGTRTPVKALHEEQEDH